VNSKFILQFQDPATLAAFL